MNENCSGAGAVSDAYGDKLCGQKQMVQQPLLGKQQKEHHCSVMESVRSAMGSVCAGQFLLG